MGDRFHDRDGHGVMESNTNAGMKIDEGTRGWLSCDVYYDTEIHPGEGGGQHLLGLFSHSARRTGPYDPAFDYVNLTGWLRLDFAVDYEQLALVLFEEANGRLFARQIGQIPFMAWRQWASLNVAWEQTETSISFTVNGQRFDASIGPDRLPIGNLVFVGNMDTNTGDRCIGDHDPCGTIGEIRYRDFRWGDR